MLIKHLFKNIPNISLNHLDNRMIKGISVDPFLCQPEFLYVADRHETVDSSQLGKIQDGRQFIHTAIHNGVKTILTTPGSYPESKHAQFIFTDNPLAILGLLYKRFYQINYPKHIAFVTGTDGKTSTVNFCNKLLGLMKKTSCSIGNLGAQTNDGQELWPPDFNLTVPDTLSLHQILNQCYKQQIDYVISEATSHALFEHRLSHVPAQIGVFTNLTDEHLNFHGNMEAYFQAKMRLFEEVLAPGSDAIINADSPYYQQVKKICLNQKHRIISVGYQGQSIQLISIIPNTNGQTLHFKIGKNTYKIQFNLHGQFQVFNLISSLGILLAFGFDIHDILPFIPLLTEIEGRFNTIGFTPMGGRIVIDFAHTINGLEQALLAAKQITKGKVYIIMGPPPDPNPRTCEHMAIMASKLADKLIITDAHAPKMDLAKARKVFLNVVPQAIEIAGRAQAIKQTCEILTKEDTLLITGMGHETFQLIGDSKIPYSDKQCVLTTIQNMCPKSDNV